MGVSNLTGTIHSIASHMTELGEELLSYHRDEDYKIIRLRDDLISAVRYALMERYKGKLLDGCEPHGGTRHRRRVRSAPGATSGASANPICPRQCQSSRRRIDIFTGRPS